MVVLKIVFYGCVFLLFASFVIYQRGYQEEGKLIFQGTVGALLVYLLLVLVIGLAPSWMG